MRLILNGGSIQTADGADSILTLGGPATVGVGQYKVDGSVAAVPRVNGVWVSTKPSNGVAYVGGEGIEVGIAFAIPVEVQGRPRLALRVGDKTRQAFLNGDSSEARRHFWFRYEVQPQDADADGISVPANALTLNGGSIRSAAGANADLHLGTHAIENTAQHKVDGSVAAVPRVNGVWVSTKPPNGVAYAGGEGIEVGIGFAIPVEVRGRPRLALRVGDKTRQAFLNGDSSEARRHFWFRYEVQPQDADADGISVPANALTLNGGSIRSAAGANADLHLGTHAIENAGDHKVDGSVAAVPRVEAVWVSSRPPNGVAYARGEKIEVGIRFVVPVEVDGSPRLAVSVGGRIRWASPSVQSSDGRNHWFRYEVQAKDLDADGISILANALQLNGGSIRSAAGANADLNLGGHAIENAGDHKVDGSVAAVPRVNGVGFGSSPSNRSAYAAGESIDIWVVFSTPIKAVGRPRLALKVGSTTRYGLLLWTCPRRDRTMVSLPGTFAGC